MQIEPTELSKLVSTEVPSRVQIDKLQAEMASMPIAMSFKTEHYFSGGMYGRKMTLPAGVLLVGRVHKTDHLFICAQGEAIVWTENGMRKIFAGDVIPTKAGTKNVVLAITETIGFTALKTDKTDVAEAEDELVENDPDSPYGVGNELKDWAVALKATQIEGK